MIIFTEHPDPGYALRTYENAKLADLTIAFALDFNTPGEILTRKCAYGKYLAVYLDPKPDLNTSLEALAKEMERLKVSNLNIAGNGIYSLKGKYTQHELDELIYLFLEKLIFREYGNPCGIRSGGQTGVDEAALKAGDRLGLQTTCLGPKGWLFRDASGRDIRNEVLFKKRFGPDYDLSFIY